jgi:hypothetical protein
MSNLYWQSEEQMARLRPHFPKSHGVSKEYGPHKTLYNRWKRWSDMGVFAWIRMGLVTEVPDNKATSVDATYPLPRNRFSQR